MSFQSNSARQDTPTEAAYHLAAAMGCCGGSQTSQIDQEISLVEKSLIQELETQKQCYETELVKINARLSVLPPLKSLSEEIRFFNDLVSKLRAENEEARRIGDRNLEIFYEELLRTERVQEKMRLQSEEVSRTFEVQRKANSDLRLQIQDAIVRIKALHDRNNELVAMFQ